MRFHNVLNSVQPIELLRYLTEELGALGNFVADVFPLFSNLRLGMVQKLPRIYTTVAEEML